MYINEKLNEFNQFLKNKKIAVIGMGVSNIPLIKTLFKINNDITVFDKKDYEYLEQEAKNLIEENDLKHSLGKNYMIKLIGFDIIFRSPSSRIDTQEMLAETKRGALVTSELEMVMKLCPGFIIGVTGSDGKTTTTSLIYEIVKAGGYNAYLGGNIGFPLYSKLEEMKPEDVIVLEISSFQLMGIGASPNISVITNITPNHLDIHKSYEEYIDTKKNIFKYQDESGIVVLNYDNEITKNMEKEVKGNIEFFSKNEKLDNGVILDQGIIKLCEKSLRRQLFNTEDVVLRGQHNFENICTAIAATKTLVPIEIAIDAVKEFKGVEHRIELVRSLRGVKWYNDSIGSSPTRSIAGINAFEEDIVLIAGGYDKNLDYEPLAIPIIEKVTTLILLGQTAKKIEMAVKRELKNYPDKNLNIIKVELLDEAVSKAEYYSSSGEIVLFSPASASFDMFKNFSERGNKFKELVNKL